MSDLIYWIAMVLIIGASAALLTGTFLSMKKNKKEKSRNTGRISARGRAYDPDEEEYSGRRHTAQEGRRRTEQQERANEKKQWKIILDGEVMSVHMKNIFPFRKIPGFLNFTVRL